MSTPVIIREFQFARDFRKIMWGSTLWYNVLRAFLTGCIFGILMIIFPQSEGDQFGGLMIPLVFPFLYLMMLPFWMLMIFIGNFFPPVNIIVFLAAIFTVTLGDPLVCILKKFVPKMVPVDSPPLFSFELINWVLNAPEISVAN